MDENVNHGRRCYDNLGPFLIEFSTKIGVIQTQQEAILSKINELEKDLKGGVKELEKRVDDLEKSRSYVLGVVAAVGFLLFGGGLALYNKVSHIPSYPQVERSVSK